MKPIERIVILNAIFSHFQMATQWTDNCDYYHKADALIDLLEVADCGSTGGYDRVNPNKRVTMNSGFDRFLTLLRKYDGDINKIHPICGADVATLTEYFKQLECLRGKVYAELPA